MDVPDGHIRQGRRQKEQCQERDQQSVLHHVRSRGRRVFQVCTTVNRIGNSQEKGLYRDAPKSTAPAVASPSPVRSASWSTTRVMRVPAIAMTSAQTLKTTMLCDSVQLSRSMIGKVILLLPLKPTAQPTRNARQRPVRVAGQISAASVKQACFTPIVATSGANVQPLAGVPRAHLHCHGRG